MVTTQLKGTPRSGWKFANQQLLTLPSGNQMVCKRPDMMSLLMNSDNGTIPDSLFAMMTEALEGKTTDNLDYRPSKEDLPKLGGFIEMIVRACAVHPRIAPNLTLPTNDDELAYDELDGPDRMFIFQWAMPSEVAVASKFPEEPAPGLAVTYDLSGVQPEPSG